MDPDVRKVSMRLRFAAQPSQNSLPIENRKNYVRPFSMDCLLNINTGFSHLFWLYAALLILAISSMIDIYFNLEILSGFC